VESTILKSANKLQLPNDFNCEVEALSEMSACMLHVTLGYTKLFWELKEGDNRQHEHLKLTKTFKESCIKFLSIFAQQHSACNKVVKNAFSPNRR
jgi:hypothetical protein